AGGFGAEQQDVPALESMIEIWRVGTRGEQNQPRLRLASPSLERRETRVASDPHLVEIVHAGAAKGAVRGRKAGRLDDVHPDAEAGREPQDRPGILGNVRLETGDLHLVARLSSARPRRRPLQMAPLPLKIHSRQGFMRLLVIAAQLPGAPTCTPPARVPIKRRWIRPLGLLLALLACKARAQARR